MKAIFGHVREIGVAIRKSWDVAFIEEKMWRCFKILNKNTAIKICDKFRLKNKVYLLLCGTLAF
jgi:uncharacterized pyridoxamine 5'-phosphate oxidase family protein